MLAKIHLLRLSTVQWNAMAEEIVIDNPDYFMIYGSATIIPQKIFYFFSSNHLFLAIIFLIFSDVNLLL